MAQLETPRPEAPAEPVRPTGRRRFPSLELIIVLLVVAMLAQPWLVRTLDGPVIQTWSTFFVSIALQALPFLVLGVVVSGLVAAFASPRLLARLFPRKTAIGVPVAGLSGVLLPGCECGSVPISARLIDGGVSRGAALTFMLAAPAVNPIVLISTAVAFPGRPEVVLARFSASLLTAMLVGFIWVAWRREKDGRPPGVSRPVGSRWLVFRASVAHDFLQAAGYLVLGAAIAATLQVLIPRTVVDSLAGSALVAVPVLALLAVVLSICSEADAFVAASLGQFPLTARLAFLVVGPAVDLKLIALQAGTFGRAFTMRFAPLTFAVAIGSALAVGWVLL